jgi:hypothetical protein
MAHVLERYNSNFNNTQYTTRTWKYAERHNSHVFISTETLGLLDKCTDHKQLSFRSRLQRFLRISFAPIRTFATPLQILIKVHTRGRVPLLVGHHTVPVLAVQLQPRLDCAGHSVDQKLRQSSRWHEPPCSGGYWGLISLNPIWVRQAKANCNHPRSRLRHQICSVCFRPERSSSHPLLLLSVLWHAQPSS